MPLARRIPKRGFTNIFREEYAEVNLDRLDKIAKAEIEPEDMVAAGLIKKSIRPGQDPRPRRAHVGQDRPGP